LEIEPYNSELHILYGEFLGYYNDKAGMVNSLRDTEQVFDNHILEVLASKPKDSMKPSQTIASIYQKIGHTYLTVIKLCEMACFVTCTFKFKGDLRLIVN